MSFTCVLLACRVLSCCCSIKTRTPIGGAGAARAGAEQLGQEDNSLFPLTGHADAAKSSTFVNTSALILARVGFALVDVHLAPTAFEARGTVTSVGTSNVDAGPTVFARRACIDEIKKLMHLELA